MECNKQYEVQYLGDLPIDNLDNIADYFIAERALVVDEATGNTKHTLVRVPGKKLFPNANMDNIVTLTPNNPSITVPADQVRAVYVANESNSAVMHYAGSDHSADMIAVGMMADYVLVQSTGFINIPEGHGLIIGAQYYVGENGEPVTDSAITGQKLFKPVSSTKLLINMEN